MTPSRLVISTKERPVIAEAERRTSIVSIEVVLVLVCKVKALEVVAAAPGLMVKSAMAVLEARVTVKVAGVVVGVAGEPDGTAAIE